jgi:hypothetical protein
MAVTSSVLAQESTQKDARRWVTETHTLTGGATVPVRYLLAAGADANAIMTARAPIIAAQAVEDEAVANMNRDGALTLVQQTAAQFAARFRQEVASASQQWACYLAWWLLRRIAAGNITDAQCQTAFNMTATAWTTFKANTITPRSNAWAAILAAAGA